MKKLKSLVPSLVAAVLLAVPGLISCPAQDTTTADAAPKVAEYLPDSTILFLHLSDVSATAKAYEGSNLKKIIDAPETAALWDASWAALKRAAGEKAGGEASFNKGLAEFLDITKPLLPVLDGEAFISWSGINMGPTKTVLPVSGFLIAGVKPKDIASYDKYVEEVKGKLKAKGMDLTAFSGTGTAEGVAYDFLTGPRYGKDNKEARVIFAKYNGWVLIAVGESALTDFVQRASGKKAGGNLAGDPLAKKAWTKLHANADTHILFNVPPLMKTLAQIPAPEIKSALNNPGLKMMGAVGASAKFVGPLIEDRYAAVTLPYEKFDVAKIAKPCPFSTLKYTSPATLIYAAQTFNLPAIVEMYNTMEFEENGQTIKISDYITQARDALKQMNLDFDAILAAFGEENAFLLDWDGKGLPELGIFFPLSKPENLVPLYTLALAQLGDKPKEIEKVTITVDEIGGNKVAYISYQEAQMIPPTVVTLGGPVLGIFSSKEAAERYLTKPAAATSVADQPALKQVLPGGITGKGYTGATYVNTPAIINQSAPMLRSAYGSFAAPMLENDAPEFAKLTLPETLTVPDLITAWAMTQTFEGDTAVTFSTSGIGNQLIPVYGLAVGIGVGVQQFMNAMSPPAATSFEPKDEKSADAIKEELDTLRTAVESYEEKASPKKGAAIKWDDLTPYLIPGSRLASSGGKDALGNAFVLGTIGGTVDVSKATKSKFPDKDAAFWADEDDDDGNGADEVPSMEKDIKPKAPAKGKGGMKLED
ncbi:hypothetical protein DB346_14985 [Verrucomicrobia bacterium LW23]|nr:hypothetical protein DB346_14985 [Verrucomicrobia bacterium LW23]